MKKIVLSMLVALFCFCGCQSQNHLEEELPPVKVLLPEGKPFPEELAGLWVGDRGSWQFYILPDGTIPGAVIGLASTDIAPGKKREIQMLEGKKGIMIPGQWIVQYVHSTQELMIECQMDYVHLEMGPHLLEGSTRDIFAGKVNFEDETWQAEWISFPDYVAYVPEPKELTANEGGDEMGVVVFKKQLPYKESQSSSDQ